MSAVILVLSSSGMRVGGLVGLDMSSLEEVGDLFKITVYSGEPEEHVVFCSSEGKRALSTYFDIRRRHGERIDKNSKAPVIREQYDRRDQFAIAHPRRLKVTAIARRLRELAEVAGIRLHIHLEDGQRSSSVRSDVPICNGFRRYYCKTLLDSGLMTEKRWLLEGHNLLGNDASYLKVTTEDLLCQYLLAHDNLLISQEHVWKRKAEKLEVEKSQFDKLAAPN